MSRTIRRKTPMMAPEKGRWGETEPILTLDQLPKWAREHPFVLNDPDKYKRLRFQKRLVVIHCDGCGKDSFIEMYRVVTPEKATDMNPSSTFTYLLPGDKRTCPRCGSREIPTLDFVFSEGASPKVTPMKAPRPDPKDPLLLSHPGFLVPPIVSFCENCNNWEHVYPMPAAHMALYTCLKCRATWDEVKEEEKQRKFGPPPKGIVVTCQHCRPKSPMAAPLGITGLSVFAIAGLLVSLPLIVWRLNSKEVA